ncbi:hypothetical protein NQ176_g10378 [Zarea fungicola]|uniref:Uncharacterized protein n=1 Tax=Zarea fungicola TaxID=93591 RepID=A0ACC1MGZ5_9HYPO|nr:hypothetical protein NQ176_g10378 [Lecanicillium fungicola]
MAAMLEFRTQGFNPHAVKYSPYYDSRIAVASAANFGIVGNGRLYSLCLTAQGIQVEKTFDTNDALYDLAWSEINENQLITACGDGSLKLFDLNVNEFPVMNFHEHKREALSVCWNPITKDTFVSSSWDGTVKIVRRPHPLRIKIPYTDVTDPSEFTSNIVVANQKLFHKIITHRRLYIQHVLLPLKPSLDIRRLL